MSANVDIIVEPKENAVLIKFDRSGHLNVNIRATNEINILILEDISKIRIGSLHMNSANVKGEVHTNDELVVQNMNDVDVLVSYNAELTEIIRSNKLPKWCIFLIILVFILLSTVATYFIYKIMKK